MKKMILIAVICFAMLALVSTSPAAEATQNQILKSYEGNLSEANTTFVSMTQFFGGAGLAIAETTKFKAPKPNWNLKKVYVLGWDGFNGTVESVPKERLITLEVRDKDLNLLYRFADIQLPYTNFLLNLTEPMWIGIDLPSIPVSDDFYICFYDRAALGVGTAATNSSTNNTFFFDRYAEKIYSAKLPASGNRSLSVDWFMQAIGS